MFDALQTQHGRTSGPALIFIAHVVRMQLTELNDSKGREREPVDPTQPSKSKLIISFACARRLPLVMEESLISPFLPFEMKNEGHLRNWRE